MWTRRQALLGGAASIFAGSLVPRVGRAAVAPVDRKFVFVWADGGWDASKVFASLVSPVIQRDPGDELAVFGGLHTISNRNRPNVDGFFDRHHEDVAKIDGILIRSINHPVCRNLWLTNSPNAIRPDWPTLIGAAAADRYIVPHMVVAGYSEPGELSALTCLSGRDGQLEQLVKGGASTRASFPMPPPPVATSALVDDFLVGRARAREARSDTAVDAHLAEAFRESSERLSGFKAALEPMSFSTDPLYAQIDQAAQLLGAGVARCVTITEVGGNKSWDTHANNIQQNPKFDNLFLQLQLLRAALDATPGRVATTLAEETVVVVLSEMGRAPYTNSSLGKDHWMYTSAMMWGPGVIGNRDYGGYDEYLNGAAVDLATGDLDEDGVAITPDVLGSTLLTLAGVDPASILGSDTTLRGMLEA